MEQSQPRIGESRKNRVLIGAIALVGLAIGWYVFWTFGLQPSITFQQQPSSAAPGGLVTLTETAKNWGGYDLEGVEIVNQTTNFTFAKLFQDYHVTSKAEAEAAFAHASGILSQTVFDDFQTYLHDGREFNAGDYLTFDQPINPRIGIPKQHPFVTWPQRPWLFPSQNVTVKKLHILPATPPGQYVILFGGENGDTLYVQNFAFVVDHAKLTATIVVGS